MTVHENLEKAWADFQKLADLRAEVLRKGPRTPLYFTLKKKLADARQRVEVLSEARSREIHGGVPDGRR